MAGALRKTMIYLGLAEDDDRYEPYDGYDEVDAPEEDDEDDLVRDEHRAPVTPITRGHMARVVPGHSMEMHRISTIHPRTYNEAKVIGEAFRAGTPVIMNLTDMDESDAKRLVDFAAGLVFGLRGSIERVTSKVFLLSPAHIEVSSANEVSASANEGGLFNQS